MTAFGSGTSKCFENVKCPRSSAFLSENSWISLGVMINMLEQTTLERPVEINRGEVKDFFFPLLLFPASLRVALAVPTLKATAVKEARMGEAIRNSPLLNTARKNVRSKCNEKKKKNYFKVNILHSIITDSIIISIIRKGSLSRFFPCETLHC